EVKRSVRRDKRAWINDLAALAQQAAESNNTKLLYYITKKLSGRRFANSPPLKAKDGTLLTSKDDQLERWTEYFTEVLVQAAVPAAEQTEKQMDNDARAPEGGELKIKIDPPSYAEIRTAIQSLKGGKAPGIDGVPPEFLSADSSTTAKLLQPIVAMAWNQEELPSDWKKGIIIKLPKKGNLSLCDNWRGITLLTSINKLTFIIFKRVSTALEPHLRGEQAGFRPHRSCIDQINTLRILIEQSQEWNSPLYLVFVDFTRAFDSLNHAFLWKVLMDYGVPDKIVRVIKALYRDASSCVAHGGVLGESIAINAGVKQGCVLSPFLFILVVDHILKSLERAPRGVLWSFQKRLEDLDYADDICLLAHTFRDMQEKLSELADLALEAGLRINIRKTKSMRLGTKVRTSFVLGRETIEEVDEFCYLGSVVTCTGGAESNVASRIKKARQAYLVLGNIWASSVYSIGTKLRIFNSNVKSVLLYGCETWKITASITRSLQTEEYKATRRRPRQLSTALRLIAKTRRSTFGNRSRRHLAAAEATATTETSCATSPAATATTSAAPGLPSRPTVEARPAPALAGATDLSSTLAHLNVGRTSSALHVSLTIVDGASAPVASATVSGRAGTPGNADIPPARVHRGVQHQPPRDAQEIQTDPEWEVTSSQGTQTDEPPALSSESTQTEEPEPSLTPPGTPSAWRRYSSFRRTKTQPSIIWRQEMNANEKLAQLLQMHEQQQMQLQQLAQQLQTLAANQG
ncbi:uncharacterized protein LOC112452576, partial [Temnothorax curvispinosus]|uniref:Uncharacterized protein LOC112452576 n=1 Tax=Temnothorax curvispinosus TaxID=300111 RepID=A0A6J1PGI2_9HYME